MKSNTVLEPGTKEKTLFLCLVIIALLMLPITAYASDYIPLNEVPYEDAAGANSPASNQQAPVSNNTNVGNTEPEAEAEPKPVIEVMSLDTYPKMGFYYDFQDVPGFSSYNRINNPQIRAYKLFDVNFFYLNGGFYSYKGAIYDYFNATDSQATNYINTLKAMGFRAVPGFMGNSYYEDFAEQVIVDFQTDPYYDKKNQAILIKEDGDQFTWVLISNSSGPTPDSTTWEDAKYAPCKEVRVYSLAPIDVKNTPLIELSAADIATVKAALANDVALLKAIRGRMIDLTKISLSKLSSILARKSSDDVIRLLEQTQYITDFGNVMSNSASESRPVTPSPSPVVMDDPSLRNNVQQSSVTDNTAVTATPPVGASSFAANVTNSVVWEKTGISPKQMDSVQTQTIDPKTLQNNPPENTTEPASQSTGGAQTLANNINQSLQSSTTNANDTQNNLPANTASTSSQPTGGNNVTQSLQDAGSAYTENTLVPLISKASKATNIGTGIKYVSMRGKLIVYEYAYSGAKSAMASYVELLTGSGFTKFVKGTDSVDFDLDAFMTMSNGISEQETTPRDSHIYKKNGTLVYMQATDSKLFISFSTQ